MRGSVTAIALALLGVTSAVALGQGTPLDPAPPDDGRKTWVRAGGAPFGELASQVTPVEMDFFHVSFLNTKNGLAVGARCRDELPARPGESAAEHGHRLGECQRVPEIWRFSEDRAGRGTWAPAEMDGADRRGYVGAVAWIDRGRALAVGGDGVYPRREPNEREESFAARVASDLARGAGRARAWLYAPGRFGDERWHELTDLPAGMRGLSALAMRRDQEWGWAGALGQLWRWEGGGFAPEPVEDDDMDHPENQSPQTRFELRVRDIELPVASTRRDVFAVTAGCCDADGGAAATTVAYDSAADRWTVAAGTGGAGGGGGGLFSGTTRGSAPGGGSAYALTVRWDGQVQYDGDVLYAYSATHAAGGPEQPEEPPSRGHVPRSRLVGADGDSEPAAQVGAPTGNGVADWEVGQIRSPGSEHNGQGLIYTTLPDPPDPRPGPVPMARCFIEFRKADDSPVPQTRIYPNVRPEDFAIPGTTFHSQVIPFGCLLPHVERNGANQVRPEQVGQPQWDPAGPAWTVDSYGLNAVDMIGGGGAGWAVGNRGALLQYGDWTDEERPPPPLGAPIPAPLPDDTPYGPARPRVPDGDPDEVPGRAELPLQRFETLQPVGYGSPEPDRPASQTREAISGIVMSRDGDEGWAFGPLGNGAPGSFRYQTQGTLYHYDGDRWTRCDPRGIGDIVPADDACKRLLPLFDHRVKGLGMPVKIYAAARVPLENDSNPGNDDEFEVVAMGAHSASGSSSPECRMMRYRDGRWRIDPQSAVADLNPGGTGFCPGIGSDLDYDVEFAAPDDGWLTVQFAGGIRIFRWNGAAWARCVDNRPVAGAAAACGNQGADGPRLPYSATGDRQDHVAGLTRAGRRIYMFGSRRTSGSAAAQVRSAPFVIYRDPGECKDAASGTDGCWRSSAGGYDPAVGAEALVSPPRTGNPGVDQWAAPVYPPADVEGSVLSVAVVKTPDGYRGWAAGRLRRSTANGGSPGVTAEAAMLRLDGGEWAPWRKRDAALDHVAPFTAAAPQRGPQVMQDSLVMLPRPAADGTEAIAGLSGLAARVIVFNGRRERWEAAPRNPLKYATDGGFADRWIAAVAPDPGRGAWIATALPADGSVGRYTLSSASNTWFHRFTFAGPGEVFEEVPNPSGPVAVRTLAAAADGSLWLGTDSPVLHRYERTTGWRRVTVRGWDPGRVVTKPSSVNAVAVGPAGDGYAVGESGRIARLSPKEVVLDPASGRACDQGAPEPPCGTGKDLLAVAVGPEGGALAGGERRALLWRPPGEEFRPISRPAAAVSAAITGVALPSEHRAWLTTDRGQVYVGDRSGSGWTWRLENTNTAGDLLSLDETLSEERPLGLRALAVGADERGFAVGDGGLVLERTGNEDEPWRRVNLGVRDNLTAVALPAGGRGDGALIGGQNGLILTRRGEDFVVARAADAFRPIRETVRGLALVPGLEEGQVEAWAALAEYLGTEGQPARSGANQLLHYSSDPGEPLLAGRREPAPLPDAPPPRPGELSFAAFGKSDCPIDPLNGSVCPSYAGSNRPVDRILQAIVGELRGREGLDFLVHTGDAYESGGEAVSQLAGHEEYAPSSGAVARGPFESGAVKFRRFAEGVLDPIRRAGVPGFGAIGGADLTDQTVCELNTAICLASTRQQTKAGLNLAWREGFASAPGPWGTGTEPGSASGLAFSPVEDRALVAGRRVAMDERPEARTHYAVDVSRGGQKIARLVYADNSLRSLAAGDSVQNPAEPDRGQTGWLERMVCVRGGAAAASGECSREPGQAAIVVMNTPTYSYGPGTVTDTAADAAAVEELLMRHRVTAVVSGRLGWNGRYWATAPGVHEPCPGGAYQEATPEPGTRVCGRSASGGGQPGARELSAVLRGLGAPTPSDADSAVAAAGADPLPFVVAASAGGGFGPAGDQIDPPASAGYWRGYSVVRLDPAGGPRTVLVEQRPVFDWVMLTGAAHVLRPGQRLRLRGIGREPIGIEQSLTVRVTRPPRFVPIDSPAITHRYDLLEADPEKPWLPKVVAGNGNPHGYVPLDTRVGTIDDQTGEVRAGRGNQGRVYALAMLSVGKRAASWPLVFEPRRAFTPPSPRRLTIPPPVPPIRVLGVAPQAVPSQPPPPPPATPPLTVDLVLPPPPALPGLPGGTPAPIAPPIPPASPPPPPAQGHVATGLAANPVAILLAPTAAPIPPSSPLIQPAPPSGARKEARQKQAATAKSEEGAQSAKEAGVDLAGGKPTPDATAFTRRRADAQPSAWVTGLQYGGGTALMALVLALGWTTVRPTPRGRRREEISPAPAWLRDRR